MAEVRGKKCLIAFGGILSVFHRQFFPAFALVAKSWFDYIRGAEVDGDDEDDDDWKNPREDVGNKSVEESKLINSFLSHAVRKSNLNGDLCYGILNLETGWGGGGGEA